MHSRIRAHVHLILRQLCSGNGASLLIFQHMCIPGPNFVVLHMNSSTSIELLCFWPIKCKPYPGRASGAGCSLDFWSLHLRFVKECFICCSRSSKHLTGYELWTLETFSWLGAMHKVGLWFKLDRAIAFGRSGSWKLHCMDIGTS